MELGGRVLALWVTPEYSVAVILTTPGWMEMDSDLPVEELVKVGSTFSTDLPARNLR